MICVLLLLKVTFFFFTSHRSFDWKHIVKPNSKKFALVSDPEQHKKGSLPVCLLGKHKRNEAMIVVDCGISGS